MARIKVGMLVEIVDHHDFLSGRGLIGHIGKVLNSSKCHMGNWIIEGAEINPESGRPISFTSTGLRPINPPQELSSWEDIQKLTNWNPSKQGVGV